NDGDDDSNTATKAISITPVNDPPTATAKSVATSSGIKVTIDDAATGKLKTGATDPDDPTSDLTVSSTFGSVTPAGATITLIDATSGTYSYDPPPGYSGSGSFTYTVCDDGAPVAPQQCSAPATVTVTITGPDLWFVDPSAATNGVGRL